MAVELYVFLRDASVPTTDRWNEAISRGYLPAGAIQYPTLGSLISKEIGRDDCPLPNFVSIAPFRQFNPAAYASGFLGPRYAPLLVADALNNPAVLRAGGRG